MLAKKPCLFAPLLPEDPAFGLVHDDLANLLVLEGLEGHVARRLALDQFEGYGLLHDLCLLFVLSYAAFLRSRRSFFCSRSRSAFSPSVRSPYLSPCGICCPNVRPESRRGAPGARRPAR